MVVLRNQLANSSSAGSTAVRLGRPGTSAAAGHQRQAGDRAFPSFAVILPMYNEEACAVSCIRGIYEFLKDVPALTSIIAVNDGSSDNTLKILDSLKESIPNLIVVNREANGGYGAANRSGFRAAQIEGYEYILVMDADGTQNPIYIDSFLQPMSQSIDFIKATRYSRQSAVVGVSLQRKLVSWVGNLLAKLMLRLPLTDYTNGFRAIRTDLANQLDTKERGFAVLVEEVRRAKELKATFAEVPYTLTARVEEGSQSKFVYSTQVYKTYLRYLFPGKV